jgi:hypothetical protein
MNHTWKDNKCTLCGCKRKKNRFGYFYSRGMQLFGINYRPDCIDWELENSKTID